MASSETIGFGPVFFDMWDTFRQVYLLFRIFYSLLWSLQPAWNVAACLVTSTWQHKHIMPALRLRPRHLLTVDFRLQCTHCLLSLLLCTSA